MAEIYGHKWVSSYGEKPNLAWTNGLKDISPPSIKYGIESLLKSGTGWPPSLPEFIERCMGVSTSRVLLAVHEKYTDKMSTYTDIARAEKKYFDEVREEMIIQTIWEEKQDYLQALESDNTKELN